MGKCTMNELKLTNIFMLSSKQAILKLSSSRILEFLEKKVLLNILEYMQCLRNEIEKCYKILNSCKQGNRYGRTTKDLGDIQINIHKTLFCSIWNKKET
jgi:hypothetical protein